MLTQLGSHLLFVHQDVLLMLLKIHRHSGSGGRLHLRMSVTAHQGLRV